MPSWWPRQPPCAWKRDGAGELELGGGEVLVETFTLAKQFTSKQVVVVVLPAEAH